MAAMTPRLAGGLRQQIAPAGQPVVPLHETTNIAKEANRMRMMTTCATGVPPSQRAVHAWMMAAPDKMARSRSRWPRALGHGKPSVKWHHDDFVVWRWWMVQVAFEGRKANRPHVVEHLVADHDSQRNGLWYLLPGFRIYSNSSDRPRRRHRLAQRFVQQNPGANTVLRLLRRQFYLVDSASDESHGASTV